VAIAGGTSATLGRSIINAILEAGNHIPIILSRSKSGSEQSHTVKYDAQIRYVDYQSFQSLITGLEDIHTVISVLKSNDPSEMLSYHSNLLTAAKRVGCKRFAPSEWESGPPAKQKVALLRLKLDIWEIYQQSGLECARFIPGWFMNYLGQGCPEQKKEQATAGLDDDLMLDYIDIGRGKVTVPHTENGSLAKVSMTEMGDIGRFFAAALDLEAGKWEADMGMVGSTVDLERMARAAEKVTGRKFEITTITKEDLKHHEDDFDKQMANEFSVEALKGKMIAQLMQCACEEEIGNQINDPVTADH
jgi:NmrA-like family